ncbi:MAG: OmpA family protein [Acetobacteraceae bacterium]|jgi:outer membrane protein OmpA-like peptidoglycan-associated protein|nr:OmpA family protein [Acetobacteraceae bacterium]
MILHRHAPRLAAAVLLALLAAPAGAQPRDPSASEIIDALRPKPGQFQPATRGIRPVSPQPAAPAPAQPAAVAPGAAPVAPAAPPVAAPAPAAVPADAPAISLTVRFATGSAELTDQARRVLDELGKALTSEDLRPFRFRIEGHTDTVGSAALNQSLSERRAAAVRAYLTSRFGVEGERLIAVGLGETRLAVDTGDNVDEPRNRRVQIVNIGG